MPSAVRLREDYSAEELRALARRSKDVNQSRRLLSLAAVRDGMDRGAAAKIGGMDRQTLRDWVHRFNGSGPEGLIDNRPKVPSLACRRSNWPSSRRSSRRVRIVRRTASCAGVGSTSSASSPRGSASTFIRAMSESSCKKLGFSHISARPRHPAQDERIVEAFKKTSRARSKAHLEGLPETTPVEIWFPGRGPDRPEERPGSAVGEARNEAKAARRSAL